MAGTERAFVAAPIPTSGARVIASPFQFWTTGEDNLRVTSICSVTGVALKVQGRFIDAGGAIGASSWDHTPRADRTAKTDEYPLGIGAALNVVVFARTGTLQIGQCFVIVQLIRGTGAAAIVLGTLLQGYVTTTQVLAWPGSPIVNSLEGEPPPRIVTGTTPAVSNGITETVPTGARWELLTLALDAQASFPPTTATLILTVYSPSFNRFVAYPAQQPFTANPAAAVQWFVGYSSPNTAATASVCSPLPMRLLLPGGSFFTTNGIASITQASVYYAVREWLEIP